MPAAQPTPQPTVHPTEVPGPLAVTWPCASHSAWPVSLFQWTDTSAAGAPIYHSSDAGWYLYHDLGCDGDDAGEDRWIFDDSVPSASAVNDLDGDAECTYMGRIDSDSALPPIGRSTCRIPCDGTWQDMTVLISAQVLELSMMIGGVDYDTLDTDPAAMAAFTSIVQDQLASSVGLGVTADMVSAIISKGSVVVKALIQIQDAEAAEAAGSHLQSVGLGELEVALSSHPDLQAAITGSVSAIVTGVKVTGVEGASPEDVESSASAGWLGGLASAAVLAAMF